MAIFNCKSCGGDLEVQEGTTVVTCEYCGRQQTVPSMDIEKKVNLFNRANRLRSRCDFDKAAGVYESIVAEFPQEAEAYWGLCLCKFGIEYVDDPGTANKIPTCHRTSYESIFDDSNFDMACENADALAVSVYRSEAKEIDRLQKQILDIAKNEEPFDVFICYKESDENGQRTVDSELAHDIYDVLTEKGYKVFYSRITLKAKLGQDYEPYIFSALNSAKVMLAIGTKYEYYNAVWVKNEWSRYLALMANDNSRTLIPCYRDIDAYDMPTEFKHLQAQDLSSPRAFQDLLNNIEKIIPKENIAQSASAQPSAGSPTVNSLIKRALLFLEEGNYSKADEYAEKALDADPENGHAYLIKLCIEYKVKRPIELGQMSSLIDETGSNYKKALKYADAALRKEITGYNKSNTENIEAVTELQRKTDIYNSAIKDMEHSDDLNCLEKAKKAFVSIAGFKDSDEMAKKCENAIKICIYDSAIKDMEHSDDLKCLEKAKKAFDSIAGFKDSDEMAKKCGNEILSLKTKIYNGAVEDMERFDDPIYLERAKKAFDLISGFKDSDRRAFLCDQRIDRFHNRKESEKEKAQSDKYKRALNCMKEGTLESYRQARQILYELDDFKDSKILLKQCEETLQSRKAKIREAENQAENKNIRIVIIIISVLLVYALFLGLGYVCENCYIW